MKVFIDCGTNKGQGLKQFIAKFNINSDWAVESFEPNPLCEPQYPEYVKFHRKAVWDKNGTVLFSQMMENDEGSSVNCLMDSGICADPNSTAFRTHDTMVQVECVDVSEILNQYADDDHIIIKIDTEGAEFTIIRKMIKDGIIKKINHLFVEWHTKYLSSENKSSESELKKLIINAGVNLHDWH